MRRIEDENALFNQVMKDVKPIDRETTTQEFAPKAVIEENFKSTPKTTEPPVRSPLVTSIIPTALDDHGAGRAPGIDRRTALRLSRGKMELDARIDLHGMTQVQARQALVGFVMASRKRGDRCVLVITGKGSPTRVGGSENALISPQTGILRRMVPVWLYEPPVDRIVLAFSPAQPKHGGAGAFYVLLKRARPK